MVHLKDAELLRKYNVAGPRYTSYPTVPYWDTNPAPAEWISSIRRGLDEAESKGVGGALYVHIPFCQSLCTYCGCNTRITRNFSVGAPYVDTVLREWDLYRQRLARDPGASSPWMTLSELHLGGGTPTFLTPDELSRLVEGLLASVRTGDDAEFSVEADPRVTSREHLRRLAELGFRRLSLGIQDFDAKVQQAVNRTQSEDDVRAVTEMARELGYESINYDLIYGLPFQTLQSIEGTIEAVRRLRPDRIAFYGYAHVPWIKPGHRRFTEEDLPAGDAKRALYELGRALLEQVGYREIGMDHFALETDSLWQATQKGELHRNFMGYTSRLVAPQIGLGVSAIGDSWRVFAQNEKLLETYQDRVQRGEIPLLRGHVLTEEDLIIRRQVLNLMTRFETDWKSERLDFFRNVPERLAELAHDGLLTLTEDSCRVHERGRAFIRNICMAFDARLARQAPGTQLFSKTI